MMKLFRWCLVALLGAYCAVCAGGTAQASEPLTPQHFEQYAEEFLEFAAEIEHGQYFVYAPGVTDFTLAQRAGTQSAEELEEMQTNERPAVFLTMDDGTIVSGAYTDTTEHARIAVDGPDGCNRAKNTCLYSKNGKPVDSPHNATQASINRLTRQTSLSRSQTQETDPPYAQ